MPKVDKPKETKRINLIVPDSLYAALEDAAQDVGVTQADLARHLLKFGYAALRVSQMPGGGVYVREPNGELEKVALHCI